MYVNGDRIVKSDCADHFGHKVSTKDKYAMCKSETGNFWKSFNMLMCDFIALLADSVPLDISLKDRFCKFAKKCLTHHNNIISSVMNIAVSNPWSAVGSNYRNYFGNQNVLNWKLSITQDELFELRVLKEMINVRDRYQICNVYSNDEVETLIELLCTN